MKRLASLQLTVIGLVLLAAGVLQHSLPGRGSGAWIVLPLALLCVNLCASMASHAAFRRNAPLLAFHLALLCIVALAGIGRLTSLKGRVELAQGESFEGRIAGAQAGPLHAGHLERVRFVNEGFTIRYAPGLRRAETRNRLRVLGPGEAREATIGDNQPLIAEGYRFYTTFNKGFSLVFRWVPARGGPVERGTVNLPSYPLHEDGQALEWRVPGTGRAVWTLLELERPALDPEHETSFQLPATHKVVLRSDGARWELAPGGEAALGDGVLVYEGLTSWMGYEVFYDWTLPWLIAACLTAVAALAWHFARRFRATPWDA
jgi:hypothetical protein